MTRPATDRAGTSEAGTSDAGTTSTMAEGTPRPTETIGATAFDRFHDTLRRHGYRINRTGADRLKAQCPAHDDRQPSLRITRTVGQTLIHCHAGCGADDVLAALGLGFRDLFDSPGGVAYRYRDGRVVHRSPDKRFHQSGNTGGTELYRLDQVREAVARREPVYVVEGEKDVHAVESCGAVATCSPMGAGKAHKFDWAPLTGAEVHVVADADEPGRQHAVRVRSILADLGCAVEVLEAATGHDAADHVAAGCGLDEFVPVETEDRKQEDKQEYKPQRQSASTALVEIAEELYEFGVSHAGETYGIPRAGPKVLRLLRGGKTSLRGQLAREYFRRFGRAAPQQALADAVLVIEGLAQDAEPRELHLRVARHAGSVWLDLGDGTGRAVEITAGGWAVAEQAPVLFKRTALNGALPEPASGELAELWGWLNVTDEDRPLVATWLVAVVFADIPHPVLGLFGEQGTGKSTAAKVLTSLLDPSPVPLRKPPRDAESWTTAASGSWVVGLDNLSAVPEWLSDSMCRAVTGDGDVRRRLYTDADMHVVAFRRCLIVNGIDLGALRGDLAERMLPITLEHIAEQDRREEHALWPDWEQAHPRLLGAVLDLAAGVLAMSPSVRLERKPRMADFARVLAAVDKVLGTEGSKRYLVKQNEIATDSLTGDPFVTTMEADLLAPFEGTAAKLLPLVTPQADKWRPPRGWPATPRQVTRLLKRQAPSMRKAGWVIHHDSGANHDKALVWTIETPEMARNEDPRHPQDPQQTTVQDKHPGQTAGHAAGHTRVAGHDTRTTCPRDPQGDRHVCPAHSATAGVAGLAGGESRPSHGDVLADLFSDAGEEDGHDA